MTTRIGASEAAHLLGVSKPTLYAYVSRGVVQRTTAVDGRTSLFDRDELARLATTSRRRSPLERPTIDVQISSSITDLRDDGLTFRGHDAVELALHHGFESVTELLLSGSLPASPPRFAPDRADLARCRSVIVASGETNPIRQLALTAATLAGRTDVASDTAGDAARRLIGLAPSVLGGPVTGDVASRLAKVWHRSPSAELVDAISRTIVLLADHELATSTLAVRVACSVRADPYAAIAAGLHTVSGPLHGGASAAVAGLMRRAASHGASEAVRGTLADNRRLPGYGHSVYRNGDPRFAPLLDAVAALPDPAGRMTVVHELLHEAGRVVQVLPNVDLAIGALLYVGDLPDDAAFFAVARLAGWAAHYDEELTERPLRYRGVARPR